MNGTAPTAAPAAPIGADPFDELVARLRGFLEEQPFVPEEAHEFVRLLERAGREGEQRRQALVDRIAGLEARIQQLELSSVKASELRGLVDDINAHRPRLA
jgi:hypothetical protein